MPNLVYAGGPDDAKGCYILGRSTGQNGDFQHDWFNQCGTSFYLEDGENRYYEGFIEGCMDADNSREVCEAFTDAN